MRPEFIHIPFPDPEQAGRRLDAIVGPQHPNLARHLADALSEAAAPGTVLVRLERFLEASLSAATELAIMARTPRYVRLLITILDQSHFLTDIVCRNPEYASWLWQEAPLDRARTREEVVEELGNQVRAFGTFEARCQSMRRFKRREILRIAARDVFAHEALPSVTEDLSNLADGALETVLAGATAELRERFGTPMAADSGAEATFAIMALGKLGGRELNFSSDIDLLFLYSHEGETAGGGRAISNAEFFQKLGERIVRGMSDQTETGCIFRVDMRLRPHGRVGPLATSIESAIGYYEECGQAWERQALIKARPAAGDLALGAEFIERTRPFVYPRYFDDATLEDIRRVKLQTEAQTEERGVTGTEVKLGRGGIRDIEFTVQMLQLLNGGRITDLRTANTLEAIAALGRHNLLRPFEADTLARVYTFLRSVEHRLQIEGSRQRHALPTDPDALDEFARRMGYASGDSFLAEYRDRTTAARAILEKFLSAEGSGSLWIYDLLNVHSEASDGLGRLVSLGFRDAPKARAELLRLQAGPEDKPHFLHVRQSFAAVAPSLIEALSACHDPDGTLVRLSQVIGNVKATGALYDILRMNPKLCEYLTTLIENSEYLTNFLIRDPSLFDVFSSGSALERSPSRADLEAELAQLRRAREPEAAPYCLRDGETLRIGLRDLFRNITVIEVGHELTTLAEVCLCDALARAQTITAERLGASSIPFAILGLGKLGGHEMGYGSDLDLVFVYDEESPGGASADAGAYFAAVAAHTIRLLKESTRFGALYDVDARLRPDGKKGVLAISSGRLREYYQVEAAPWERLALLKVRTVAGDVAFGSQIEQTAREMAFTLPLNDETVGTIDDVRAKIVHSASPLDLKKGEGGLAEIEFAVRLLQVRYGAQTPELKRGDMAGALDVLATHGLVDAKAFGALAMTYFTLRRLENRIRMMHGRSGSELPSDPAERIRLARRIGIEGDPVDLAHAQMAAAHEAYRGFLARLFSRPVKQMRESE